jgi:hypothetical protein
VNDTPSASGRGAGNPGAIHTALDQATSAIEAARTLLRQGTIIDLKGLEEHVEHACGMIGNVPPGDRQNTKLRLAGLIDSLNALTDEMTAQHQELSGALKGVGQRRQALSAYRPRGRR